MKNYFAIIIGVGGDLVATEKDAQAIYNILVNPDKGGYNSKNIKLLINQNSTKGNIIKAFDTLINATNRMKKSTIFIYYSGHGNRYQNSNGDFEYYLKTHGSDNLHKEETMLNGKIFSEKINSLKSEKLLVLLDCCHAAGFKTDQITKKNGDINYSVSSSSRALLKQLNTGTGKVFISSCDDNEQSVILPKSENSLFTEVALEVLNGFLSISEEFVGVIDLIYHIIKEVPKRVKQFDHIQRPIVNEATDLSPDYYVCKNGSFKPNIPSAIISTLIVDKVDTGEVRSINEIKIDGLTIDLTSNHDENVSIMNLIGNTEMKIGNEINEINEINDFLIDVKFKNQMSDSQKVEFVNQIGGFENFGKIKLRVSENSIETQNMITNNPNYNIQNTINSSLELGIKLNYIKQYQNKI